MIVICTKTAPSTGINACSMRSVAKVQAEGEQRALTRARRAVDACRRQIPRTGDTMQPQRLSCAFRWLCDAHLGSTCE